MAKTKQKADNLVTLYVRIPDELKADLEFLAEKQEVSTSLLCADILKIGLDNYDDSQVPAWVKMLADD